MVTSKTEFFIVVVLLHCASIARADTVNFDFAQVGNAGNAADPETGFGAVSYNYAISKTEVTNAQYAEFLNAVEPTGVDLHALWYPGMAVNFGGIELQADNADGSKFVARAGREQNPVNYVSFFDATRFANWLHNGQGSGDTETGAYTIDDGGSAVRSASAKYWIPSEDEWYKAAYHDASAGTAGVYFDYATGSDSAPVSDQPDDGHSPAANYYNDDNLANGFNDGFAVSGSTTYPSPSSANPFTDVGAYSNSASPYGTFDQNGNVYEWTEGTFARGARGGSWFADSDGLRGSHRLDVGASVGDSFVLGFRVATVFHGDGDFNFDGIIDGADFIAWQRDPFVGNLVDWEAEFAVSGSLVHAGATVPEPSSASLLVVTLSAFFCGVALPVVCRSIILCIAAIVRNPSTVVAGQSILAAAFASRVNSWSLTCKGIAALAFLSLVLGNASFVHADTFGSGPNSFEIEFVTVGNPGNAADTTGDPNPAGSVPYVYRIGKFEISEDLINKANAETADDQSPLNITHDNRGANKPATNVTWLEAARFSNWLNTSTGHSPAYKFDDGGAFQLWEPADAGYDPDNLFRNSLAAYFLPSVHEWYKAAYYDPVAEAYYDFPTGSDERPDGIDFAGDPVFDAVFQESGGLTPYDVDNAGALSPFGTMAQGGNVTEWGETSFDLVNDSTTELIAARGGNWDDAWYQLLSTNRNIIGYVDTGGFWTGFRVASIADSNALEGDFNFDGIVDGADFIAWQRDPFLGNLVDWEAEFAVSGSLLHAGATVPEPSSATLLVVTLSAYLYSVTQLTVAAQILADRRNSHFLKRWAAYGLLRRTLSVKTPRRRSFRCR